MERHDYLAVIKRYHAKVKSPLTAIRAKCVECSGGMLKEVNECRIVTCALHPFRMGQNAFDKRVLARKAEQGADEEE